jgi:hypothetical protein
MRRQRLRSAMATARLAASWPMMCLSSSDDFLRGHDMCGHPPIRGRHQFLDGEVAVGVDADVGGDAERLLTISRALQLGVLQQRARAAWA